MGSLRCKLQGKTLILGSNHWWAGVQSTKYQLTTVGAAMWGDPIRVRACRGFSELLAGKPLLIEPSFLDLSRGLRLPSRYLTQ